MVVAGGEAPGVFSRWKLPTLKTKFAEGKALAASANFGSTTFFVTDEHENVFQILDNVTKIKGNHSLKFGVNFQSVRFSTLQPPYPRGTYDFTGLYTSDLNASFTGYGVADFHADQNNNAQLSNEFKNGDAHWYRAAYPQDDWRATSRLTLNLGLRYDFYQPYKDVGGYQATYYVTGPTGPGFGSGVYQIPQEQKSFPLSPTFTTLLAKDNIALQYVGNPALVDAQHLNFAPRFGVSYSADPKTVVRSGFGIFYGGLESTGYYPNLGENYPFQFTDTFTEPNCAAANCPSISDPAYGGGFRWKADSRSRWRRVCPITFRRRRCVGPTISRRRRIRWTTISR